MENQGSVNPTSTTDYDDMGDLVYDDDDDDDGGKKNLAYNILKYLEDDTVKNKEIRELEQCTECTNNILSSPINPHLRAYFSQTMYREATSTYQTQHMPISRLWKECRPNSIRRGSQSSQSSRTSALTNLIGEKFVLNSPVIPEEGRPTDPMDVDPDGNVELMSVLLSGGKQSSSKTTEVAKETSNQVTNPKCEKCSEDITIDLQKDTAFLSCKHAVHLDCINDLRKRCPTCTSADDMETDNLETSDPSGLQKKRSNESTEKSSSKKAKKSGEKKGSRKGQVSGTLKNLIEELSSETSQDSVVTEEGTGDFFDLYNSIINMEGQEEIAKRDVIKSYFNFGKALDDCFNYYKKDNPKRTAQALVNKKVREQLPNVSDEAIRKKKEWALKIYDLFSEIGEHMIQRIKSFSVSTIAKLSQDDIDHILVKFAK